MSGRAKLYCDGASSGNPGDAGIGGVLIVGERRVPYSEYIGTTTNNVAEYAALLRGLEIALKEGVAALDVFSDSELMVSQLRGSYKVKSPHLKPLYDRALGLLASIGDHSVSHVARESNAEADRLAKSAVKLRQRRSGQPTRPWALPRSPGSSASSRRRHVLFRQMPAVSGLPPGCHEPS